MRGDSNNSSIFLTLIGAYTIAYLLGFGGAFLWDLVVYGRGMW